MLGADGFLRGSEYRGTNEHQSTLYISSLQKILSWRMTRHPSNLLHITIILPSSFSHNFFQCYALASQSASNDSLADARRSLPPVARPLIAPEREGAWTCEARAKRCTQVPHWTPCVSERNDYGVIEHCFPGDKWSLDDEQRSHRACAGVVFIGEMISPTEGSHIKVRR